MCTLFPLILSYFTFKNYLILFSSCFTQTIAYYKTISPKSVIFVASRRQINHTGSNNVSFIILWPNSFILLFLLFYFCFAFIPFFFFWRNDSLFFSVLTIFPLTFILDGALRLRVRITLICPIFLSRPESFFCEFLRMLRVQNQKV